MKDPIDITAGDREKQKISDIMGEIERLFPEKMKSNHIKLWFDDSVPLEDEELTEKDIREKVIIDFKGFLTKLGVQDTEKLVTNLCKKEDPEYSLDSTFTRSEDNPLSEKETILLTDKYWREHIERIIVDRNRLAPEEVSLIQAFLITAGVIPEGVKLNNLNLIVLPVRKNEDVNHSIIKVLDSSFLLDGEKYPSIKKEHPGDLLFPFQYTFDRCYGKLDGNHFEDVYLTGGVDANIMLKRAANRLGHRGSTGFVLESTQVELMLMELNDNFFSRANNQRFTRGDTAFVNTVYEILERRFLGN
ncbi:MAG: hypothetical protein AB9915_02940 [Candidatus Dojkabacteria bacterium]